MQVLKDLSNNYSIFCPPCILQPHFPKHGSIRELAVHVSETAISVGDKGLIIVGASVLPPTLAESEEDDGV